MEQETKRLGRGKPGPATEQSTEVTFGSGVQACRGQLLVLLAGAGLCWYSYGTTRRRWRPGGLISLHGSY